MIVRPKLQFGFLAAACCVLASAALSGCAKSDAPQIQQITVTKQPTFGGLTSARFNTPSPLYVLSGECDPLSKGIQYSTDQANWTELPGGCANGAFSFSVTLRSTKTLYVRARTKNGDTPASQAFIRLLLAPTSPSFTFVASGNTDDESQRGMQTTLSADVSAVPMNNGARKLFNHLPGIVYGQ